jgi:hypothetical protein
MLPQEWIHGDCTKNPGPYKNPKTLALAFHTEFAGKVNQSPPFPSSALPPLLLHARSERFLRELAKSEIIKGHIELEFAQMELGLDQDQKCLIDCLSATLDTSHDVRSFAEESLKQASLNSGSPFLFFLLFFFTFFN